MPLHASGRDAPRIRTDSAGLPTIANFAVAVPLLRKLGADRRHGLLDRHCSLNSCCSYLHLVLGHDHEPEEPAQHWHLRPRRLGRTTLSSNPLLRRPNPQDRHIKGDSNGATMDYMDLERRRGITITSAATTVQRVDHPNRCSSTRRGTSTHGRRSSTVPRVRQGGARLARSAACSRSRSPSTGSRRYHVPRLASSTVGLRRRTNPDVVERVKEKLGCDAV